MKLRILPALYPCFRADPAHAARVAAMQIIVLFRLIGTTPLRCSDPVYNCSTSDFNIADRSTFVKYFFV